MTIESLEAELLRVNQNLKECTVLRAETFRDFIEMRKELKLREKEVRGLTTELKDERNDRGVYHENY